MNDRLLTTSEVAAYCQVTNDGVVKSVNAPATSKPWHEFRNIFVTPTRISGGVEFDGALTTGLTYQPGGGVDIRVTPKVGIRLQGDYRVIRTQGINNKQSRILVGVVFWSGQL